MIPRCPDSPAVCGSELKHRLDSHIQEAVNAVGLDGLRLFVEAEDIVAGLNGSDGDVD